MNSKPRTRKKIIAWIIGVTMAGGLLAWAFFPRSIEVDVGRAEVTTLVESIVADGRFRSVEHWRVTAFADGDLRRMPLKVGDVVKKGQILTELFWDTRYVPVRASMDGVISKVFRESAGPIRRGEPIVEIVDPDRLEVVAEFLTPEAEEVRVGDRAWIRGWGGPGSLEARVTRVSRAGFTKLSALGVDEERTEISLVPTEGGTFRAGSEFHVEVEIQTRRTEGALCVPAGAVFKDEGGFSTYVVEGGRATLRSIEAGRRNDDWVEVRSGLAEGTLVIVYPGDLVRPGSRVKASKKAA